MGGIGYFAISRHPKDEVRTGTLNAILKGEDALSLVLWGMEKIMKHFLQKALIREYGIAISTN